MGTVFDDEKELKISHCKRFMRSSCAIDLKGNYSTRMLEGGQWQPKSIPTATLATPLWKKEKFLGQIRIEGITYTKSIWVRISQIWGLGEKGQLPRICCGRYLDLWTKDIRNLWKNHKSHHPGTFISKGLGGAAAEIGGLFEGSIRSRGLFPPQPQLRERSWE